MVHIETNGKVLVVTPTTELDCASVERMRAAVDAAFEKSPCTHIVVDLAKVGFMDSSGIGMLIGRYKNAGKRGGGLALANMSGEMARLYNISGLSKIVGNYASVGEALSAIKGGKQ